MNDQELIERVSKLTPTQFENLVFDIVRSLGFKNVVWRTPGSDGGRDIEGYLATFDPTGFSQIQKWHIECKRYSNSIDWQTIWGKLAHADGLGADVFFLVTNSTPSPQSENRITKWNNDRRRPAIRVWRGYNFPTMLRSNLEVAVAHGIVENDNVAVGFGASIALELAKLVHSAYGAIEFEGRTKTAIEAASALAELLEQRLQDLRRYGRFIKGPVLTNCDDFGWLEIKRMVDSTEEVAFRALVTMLRHFSQCEKVVATSDKNEWIFDLVHCKKTAAKDIQASFLPLNHWLRCDNMVLVDSSQLRVILRE